MNRFVVYIAGMSRRFCTANVQSLRVYRYFCRISIKRWETGGLSAAYLGLSEMVQYIHSYRGFLHHANQRVFFCILKRNC